MDAVEPGGAARVGEAGPRDRVGPADVLGVPVLPPGRLTRVGDRVRAGLARLQRGSAPPPVRLLEAALGGLDLAVLAALCRLEVPDRLEQPTTCARLARDLALDEDRLARVLGYAATRGWLRIDRAGRVRATRVTRFLSRRHPGGWRAWIEFASGDEVARALGALHTGLTPGGDAFATANGAPFFDWMAAHPDRHATFDAAMAAGGRMHGLLLARGLDWTGSERVCDIGGGDGALLGVLLAQHPHLHGVLLEVPEVVARVVDRPRMTVVAGDAFAEVPAGADTYLLVNVVHDWDDDAVVRLLRRTAEAMATAGPTSRVVILESEAPQRPRDDFALRADLLMLALTPGGRERTTQDVAALATRSGLRLRGSHRLPSGEVAHELTRA